MKTAVIGSRGFIGRHLVAHLKSSGREVAEYSTSLGNGIDPDTGRLTATFQLPSDVEAIIYLAQSPFYRIGAEKGVHLLNVNVVSALDVAAKAQEMGVRRFIYASTGSVYAPSFGPLAEDAPLNRGAWYPLSKIHGEEALALLGGELEVIRIRLFGVYGPGQAQMLVPNLIRRIQAGEPLFLAPDRLDDGDTGGLRISLCYVEDVVRIMSALIDSGGPGCLNVAGPQAVSIREIAEKIGRALDKPPSFENSEEPRPSDLVADITRLAQSLGPRFTPLSEGIERTVSAL